MRRRLTNVEIWGWPVALGLLSVIGLTAALLADGAGDVVSWAALAIPLLVIARFAVLDSGRGRYESSTSRRPGGD